MKRCFRAGIPLLLAGLFLGCTPAADAAVIASLGNTSPGFNDGDVPDIFQLIAAQDGQPAPFDGGYGSDSFENFTATWVFTYASILNPIASAFLRIGIVDHDSSSPASQVAAFLGDGTGLTSSLDLLLEGSGGTSGEYNIYSLSLPSLIFASLMDGSVSFTLTLQGPVMSPDLFGGPDVEEPNNGASLIFSELDVTEVPEPGTAALVMLGLAGALAVRWRRR